jgi:hypothetical protein
LKNKWNLEKKINFRIYTSSGILDAAGKPCWLKFVIGRLVSFLVFSKLLFFIKNKTAKKFSQCFNEMTDSETGTGT